MRMRNKPWALDYLSKQSTVVLDPKSFKGQWLNHTPYTSLSLEIGAGKGDYVHAMAKLYPEVLWVAVEKDKNVSAVALKKFEEDPRQNVRWIVGNAEALSDWFEHGEVSVLHLNFSDPWPKKAHTKRRLTSDGFIERMMQVGCSELLVKLKTDNMNLYEFSLVQFSHFPFTLDECSVDYRRTAHPEDAITEYEQRFMDLNQVIYRAVWRRKQ